MAVALIYGRIIDERMSVCMCRVIIWHLVQQTMLSTVVVSLQTATPACTCTFHVFLYLVGPDSFAWQRCAVVQFIRRCYILCLSADTLLVATPTGLF
jgi:hypothetical protein